MFKFLLESLVYIVLISTVVYVYADDVKAELELQQVQGKCIAEKIKLGIPRSQIITTTTGCKLK